LVVRNESVPCSLIRRTSPNGTTPGRSFSDSPSSDHPARPLWVPFQIKEVQPPSPTASHKRGTTARKIFRGTSQARPGQPKPAASQRSQQTTATTPDIPHAPPLRHPRNPATPGFPARQAARATTRRCLFCFISLSLISLFSSSLWSQSHPSTTPLPLCLPLSTYYLWSLTTTVD